jgi:hypothetical protein
MGKGVTRGEVPDRAGGHVGFDLFATVQPEPVRG